MSVHIKNFIDITRLNKPIGFLLLFWPCTWGLSLAYYFHKDTQIFLYHFFLFFCGSILMRSAGCIVNDIVDEKIDKKVYRTKTRPIPRQSQRPRPIRIPQAETRQRRPTRLKVKKRRPKQRLRKGRHQDPDQDKDQDQDHGRRKNRGTLTPAIRSVPSAHH